MGTGKPRKVLRGMTLKTLGITGIDAWDIACRVPYVTRCTGRTAQMVSLEMYLYTAGEVRGPSEVADFRFSVACEKAEAFGGERCHKTG